MRDMPSPGPANRELRLPQPTGQVFWISPIGLPSASVTVAISVPPPTSCGSPWAFRRRDQRVDRGGHVVDLPVADRSGHPLLVAVRVEADLLAVDVEADVVGLVRVRLPEQGGVHRLGGLEVPHGVDDGLESGGRSWLLLGLGVTSRWCRTSTRMTRREARM